MGDAAAQLAPVLDQFAQEQDWAALAAVLRRIIGGDRGDSLLDGLDPTDTAITGQVLTRLACHRTRPPGISGISVNSKDSAATRLTAASILLVSASSMISL